MKRPCVRAYVFNHIFPRPSPEEPQDWTDFVTRCIVPEVRIETVRFYGMSNDEEARWPGLDYSYHAHQLRLSAFPHHKALFDAFKRLRLTSSEIYELCKWEGTKYAKDRYNSTNGNRVRDTTFDGIRADNRQRNMAESRPHRLDSYRRSGAKMPPSRNAHRYHETAFSSAALEMEPDLEHDDDQVVERSVGVTLNERLRAATAARLQGQDVQLDPDYEQWLKDAREQGTLRSASLRPSTSASPFSAVPTSTTHRIPRPRSLSTSNYWTQTVPEIFQYGTQNIYQTPILAHIAQSHQNLRAPSSLRSLQSSPRYQIAPAYVPTAGHIPGSRRDRRQSEARR